MQRMMGLEDVQTKKLKSNFTFTSVINEDILLYILKSHTAKLVLMLLHLMTMGIDRQ